MPLICRGCTVLGQATIHGVISDTNKDARLKVKYCVVSRVSCSPSGWLTFAFPPGTCATSPRGVLGMSARESYLPLTVSGSPGKHPICNVSVICLLLASHFLYFTARLGDAKPLPNTYRSRFSPSLCSYCRTRSQTQKFLILIHLNRSLLQGGCLQHRKARKVQ